MFPNKMIKPISTYEEDLNIQQHYHSQKPHLSDFDKTVSIAILIQMQNRMIHTYFLFFKHRQGTMIQLLYFSLG